MLSYSKVYLCGQVENDSDATRWRIDIAQELKKINNNIVVWDPLIKPEWVGKNVANYDVCIGYKDFIGKCSNAGLHEKGRACFEANKAVRRQCKQLAYKCDWMIARLNKKFTWGSIDEIEIAITRNIPIFLWLPDKKIISTYGVPGCINEYDRLHNYLFYNKKDLLDKISAINNGSSITSIDAELWMFLTWKDAKE